MDLFYVHIILACLLLVALICRAVTILGAARMLQGKSYGMGVTGSILAMIPCSPLWLVSLPIAIWSLAVLNRQDVKLAFQSQQRNREAIAHETPKPQKLIQNGWFVLVLVLVGLFLTGFLVFRVRSSGDRPPAKRVEPQGATERTDVVARTDPMPMRPKKWELGPDGPALTDQFARYRKLDPSQHQQVNKILQDIYREYLVLLEKNTQRSVNAYGHQVTTVTPFPKEINKLEEKLWGGLDPLLDREQQNLFRLNLPLYPKEVRRRSFSDAFFHDRGIFGFGNKEFQIEIWRVGEWFHWRVQDKAVWPGSYPSGSNLQKTPELPEAFRRWWKEPAEEGNQNDVPD